MRSNIQQSPKGAGHLKSLRLIFDVFDEEKKPKRVVYYFYSNIDVINRKKKEKS